MRDFIKKHKKYKNFNNFLAMSKKYRFKNLFIYDQNSIIKNNIYIKKMKETFKNINIELDSIESTDKNIIMYVFNLNNCYMSCLFLIIHNEKKTYIIDIKTNSSIFESNESKELICENIARYIIDVIIKISQDNNITEIHYRDYAEHICEIQDVSYLPDFSYSYDYANTLTNGQPLLYELGFRYINNFDYAVNKNNEKINFIITGSLEYDFLKVMIRKKVKKILIKEDIINELKKIKILYKEYKFKIMKDFLLQLKIQHPKIFSLVYFDIYNFLKFEDYGTRFMILDLKTIS